MTPYYDTTTYVSVTFNSLSLPLPIVGAVVAPLLDKMSFLGGLAYNPAEVSDTVDY